MKVFISLLLFIFPFLIAIFTGRFVLAILITIIIFNLVFIIQNMGGGHFDEALMFALGLSIFAGVPTAIGAFIGTGLYYLKSKSSAKTLEMNNSRMNSLLALTHHSSGTPNGAP